MTLLRSASELGGHVLTYSGRTASYPSYFVAQYGDHKYDSKGSSAELQPT